MYPLTENLTLNTWVHIKMANTTFFQKSSSVYGSYYKKKIYSKIDDLNNVSANQAQGCFSKFDSFKCTKKIKFLQKSYAPFKLFPF